MFARKNSKDLKSEATMLEVADKEKVNLMKEIKV
jgi:hypothetical protein